MVLRTTLLTFFLAPMFLVGPGGCGNAPILNPAFLNTTVGGQFPVTPGPNANFILVRAKNETNQTVEFIVTIEREVGVLNDDGSFQIDPQGDIITQSQRETVRLLTNPTGLANELGTLFACDESAVTKIGLGENLLPTDDAIFVGGGGAGGQAGFGVPAGALNPLDLFAGNFNCRDTVIFRAFLSSGVTGGVAIQPFILPGSQQPGGLRRDTFVNYQNFLQSQVREDEP